MVLIGGLLFLGINACTKYVYQIGHLPAEYIQCIDVVYIVGIGALINISTGVNSAIVFYSKHYILGTIFLVITFAITVVLNLLLIPIYGIYGAAIASASASFIFNFVKFFFIYQKFKFQPYTLKSLYIMLLIICCSVITYFLPEINSNSFINLIYKGGVVSLLYIITVYQLKLAPELFNMIKLKLIKSKN